MANTSRISKLLSLMLRHRPDEFGLEIDAYGYAPLDQVVQGVQERYAEVAETEIVDLVNDPDQYRFELNEFGIRALYGHSFFVDMDGEPMDPPPERLYMGTTRSAAQRFAREGISPGDRYYVHLSLTREAAESHSHQRDTPCVVEILAAKAHEEGCRFFARGAVVLTEEIPASCIGPIHGNQQQPLGVAQMPAPDGISYGRKPRFSPR
ncbi:MAG: RNA 2'-phosphotransferase [Gemmatimonadetes bacterium]|nr:RNA 2'-phosphotransferase [Gemmatimonadota bacterium]